MDKAYLKRALLYFLAAVLSVALIVYIGYHVRKFFTKEVETTPAKLTEQSFGVRLDGYIFRSEKTLSASAQGTVVPSVADGSHVHVGEGVAEIYSGSDAQAQAELAAAREQLVLLEKYTATKRGAKDAAGVDSRIYSLLTQMKSLKARNDLAGVSEMRSELLAVLNERDVASGVSSGNFDDLIAAVNASIAEQKGKLGSVLATVSAPETGWFYSSVDGYEELFDPAKIDTLTVERFEELISASPAPTADSAGKLALDYKWYLVIEPTVSEIAGLEEGDRRDVSFAYNGGESVTMTVERVIAGTDKGKALVVLSSVQLIPGFSFSRCQTVDLTVETLSGLSVPRSSVRLVDGVQGVYVFDGVYSNFRRIEVLREYEDTYIVKTDTQIAKEQAKETEEAAEFAAETSNKTPEKTEEAFDARKAPYLSENELIVVEGKGMFDGKVIS
jgi:hypothetical protein